MKRKLGLVLVAVFALAAGCVFLKLTIPFSYKEIALKSPAIEFVKSLQTNGEISPQECAARYLYFKTDYHSKNPEWIKISEKQLSENNIRVTLHNPRCQDDSTYESISRIYLEKNDQGIWIPVKHEWSQKGRGRFGWTTEPTT